MRCVFLRWPARLLWGSVVALFALGIVTCSSWSQLLGRSFTPTMVVLALVVVSGYLGGGLMVRTRRRLRRHRQLERGCLALRQPPSPRLRAAAAALVPDGALYELPTAAPLAFCLGLWHPTIYVSTGLVNDVSSAALRAVVAHEEAHRQRRDPLRHFLWAGLLTVLPRWPELRVMTERLHLRAEVAADQFARTTTSTPALAAALLHLLRHPATWSEAVAWDQTIAHLLAPPNTTLLHERLAYLARPPRTPLPSWWPPLPRKEVFVRGVPLALGTLSVAGVLLLSLHQGVIAQLGCALHRL